MTPFKHAVQHSPEMANPAAPGNAALEDLPVLTEIVPHPETDPMLSATDRQELLHQLEKHLETLFTQKLAQRLEQLQRQAIDHALSELKDELPELLRQALHKQLDLR